MQLAESGVEVMNEQLQLSEAELALVVELLRREQSELPAEIRHTRTTSVRKELRDRRLIVNRLLDRLSAIELV